MAAGGARANTVSYTGQGINLQSGQTKGLPVLIGFELRGAGCPSGPRCFDHASVGNFSAVSWAYPNCPKVLDGAFTFHKPITSRVARKTHKFSASGANENYPTDHVTFAGRLLRRGGIAQGGFTVTDSGCSTGVIHWKARPD